MLFDTKSGISSGLSTEYSQLDVTNLPPGNYYIQVYATAPDAPDAAVILSPSVIIGNPVNKPYIKLQ